MLSRLSPEIVDQFSPEDMIDTSSLVDDCRCACRAHFSVRDGLLNVHGQPIFDRLLVVGDLTLRGNLDLQRLPELLAVTGSIDVSGCANLRVLPSAMHAGEAVYMTELAIRELPTVMTAGGAIKLEDCPNLAEIPAGIRASSLHAARCAKLKKLGTDLSFHILDLSETMVTEIPSDLAVGNLKLRDCGSLMGIGEGATVRDAIDVRGCDGLFTLPTSVQPGIAITDGMILMRDWVIVPTMSAVEGNLCLGERAIGAFPHRHFKNLERMQNRVIKVDRERTGLRSGLAVGLLEGDRQSKMPIEFMRQLINETRSESLRLPASLATP